MDLPRFYLITERKLVPGGDLLASIEASFQAGVRLLQIREKEMPGGPLYNLAGAVKELAKQFDAKFLINDRVDVAAAIGADGAHLGSRGVPLREAREILGEKALIGYSAHTAEEAKMASLLGANFVTMSPVFPTRKEFTAPLLGLEGLQYACAESDVPVYGLGGITPENAPVALDARAYGVALVSYVFADADPGARAREMVSLVEGEKHYGGSSLTGRGERKLPGGHF